MRIAKLCDLYFAEGTATKKASTLKIDEGRIKRHIKPMLGNIQIGALRKADVEKFMRDIADGKTTRTIKTKKHGKALIRGGNGTATKCVSLLGAFTHLHLIMTSPLQTNSRTCEKLHAVTRQIRRTAENEIEGV